MINVDKCYRFYRKRALFWVIIIIMTIKLALQSSETRKPHVEGEIKKKY